MAKPDITLAIPLLQHALRAFQWVLSDMENRDGWFSLPPEIAQLYQNLKISHWAEFLDDKKKVEAIRTNWWFSSDEQIELAGRLKNASAHEKAQIDNELLVHFTENIDELEKQSIEDFENSKNEFEQLDESAKADAILNQQMFWLTFMTSILDILSLMTHGEKLTTLVSKAINDKDDDAFVKAVQIDGTLLTGLPYFKERYWQARVGAETNFLDSLSYRTNNPTGRGEVRYPLLWFLFDFLYELKLLDSSLTNNEILKIYSDTPITIEKQIITDMSYIRKQRKKFLASKGK